MKYLLICFMGLGITYNVSASTVDPFGVQGTYSCDAVDSVDGEYSAKLELIYNAKHSIPEQMLGAYTIKLTEPGGILYKGMASLSGNNIAISFANTAPGKGTDNGVGIAYISRRILNNNAKSGPSFQVEFDKFYYEANYSADGSHGFEHCKKI